MADAKPVARPLSPHLQIYWPLINMVMSILHRITGLALYFGTILLAWWLIAAALGQKHYDYMTSLFAAWPFGVPVGRIILFGYTWALIHHMLGGVRHLIWDTGRGFDLKTVNLMCWLSIIGSVVLTLVVWGVALGFHGDL
jgi:succinate dehydrogenase / fumarate reductase cytochrome b subunit